MRCHSTHVFSPLDIAAMQGALQFLCGTHDFTAFRGSQCQAKSPVRTVSHAHCYRQGELVVVDIAANAFLHHMVRNIVGSLILVGKGHRQPSWIQQLLHGRDRQQAGIKAPPQGLYLQQVLYPVDYGLPTASQQLLGLDVSRYALLHDSPQRA